MSFQQYCKAAGLQGVDTASAISVDLYEDLAPELRSEGVMVLRLGSHGPRSGTSFALVRANDLLSDFFLPDGLWGQRESVQLAAPADVRRYAPLRMFPTASEYSLLAAGLNAGVFTRALGLDDEDHAFLPISGHFTATFEVLARPGVRLEHRAGQVEVDATFLAHRGGRPTLFVIESKRGPPRVGLAKHKLAYPILAMAPKLDPEIAMVPVYCRTWLTAEAIHFAILECAFPDPRRGPAGLHELVPRSAVRVVLQV